MTLVADDTTDHGVLGAGSADTAVRQRPVGPKGKKPVGPSSGDLPLVGALATIPLFLVDEGTPTVPLLLGTVNAIPDDSAAEAVFQRLVRKDSHG